MRVDNGPDEVRGATGAPPAPYRRVGVPRRLRGTLAFLGAGLAGYLLWRVYRSPSRVDLSAFWQLAVAVVTLFLTALPLLGARRARRPRPDLDSVQDDLAAGVLAQWEEAASERNLQHPEAIDVRWAEAPSLAGPVARAVGSTAFAPVPGYEPVDRRLVGRGGAQRELHRIWGGLRSGRLVVAGPPGSGKSAAAVLLVVDALRHRRTVGAEQRAAVPVPVLFTFAGWNPADEKLRTWLTSRLQRDYEQLFLGRDGADVARRLLDEGRVAVVLDGLDEIADTPRRIALEVLNGESGLRMVLLSRSEELATTAGRQLLSGAVAVALQPVEPAQAADYLADVRSTRSPSAWADLVEHVRQRPHGPLARLLSSPLMITLVRDACRDEGDARRLLDLRDSNSAAIEDHLLDRLVEVAYRPRPADPPPPYDVDTARRALRWVARRMAEDGSRDLAWWRIPRWAPRASRVAVVAATTGLAGALGVHLGAVANWPFHAPLFGLLGATGAAAGAWSAGARTTARSPSHWSTVLTRPALVLGYCVTIGVLTVPALLLHLGGSGVVLGITVGVVVGWVLLAYAPYVRRPRGAGELVRLVGLVFLGLGLGWAGMLTVARLTSADQFTAVSVLFSALGAAAVVWLALSPPHRDRESRNTPVGSSRRRRWAALVGWFLLAIPCFALSARVVLLPDFSTAALFWVSLGLGGTAVVCGVMLGLAFPESWLSSLAALQIAVRHRLPVRLMTFLDDARRRGVLRAVGPVYQFRHARLQDHLARREPVRPTAPRTPPAPRAVVVGAAAGGVVWLGLGVLYPGLALTPVAGLAAVAAGLGGSLGFRRRSRRGRTPTAAPPFPGWSVRSSTAAPVAGALVGVAGAGDLHQAVQAVLPGAVQFMHALPAGLLGGVLIWWLVGVALRLVGGRHRFPTVSQRWHAVGADLPPTFRFLIGTAGGYFGVTGLLMIAGLPTVFTVQLAVGLVVLAACPALGPGRLRRAGPEPTPSPSARARLVVWAVAGGLLGGFLVRGGVRVAVTFLGPETVVPSGYVIATSLALLSGLALGAAFPWRATGAGDGPAR